ncbi:hypothetical protein [Saccharothrix algeriensis]|uniref:Uncharacterized protein n=1 Tax=Saccharothrix algeriensis TaxID=173560 RepID=A0A8T8I2L5_9PSEU|nr:hypothetical protein [Saccharothrix algeriensis]MBM7811147.1 hypothetical protein [Saccharothrix algeriensis]QTR05075.1 hypothetical protein J7S33_10370 [Saccharothrix algeriensis]
MPTLPITANYLRAGDDWTVTVRAGDQVLGATAPGLIAARVQVDLLVEEIARGHADRAVVHLLDGDALAFSAVYLHTRHGLAVPVLPHPEPSTPHDQAIEV